MNQYALLHQEMRTLASAVHELSQRQDDRSKKRSKTRKSHSKLKRIEELEKQVLELNRTIESRNNHSSSVECSNHLNSQTLFGVHPGAGGSCGHPALAAGGSISGEA